MVVLTSVSVQAQTKIFMKYGNVSGSAVERGYDDGTWMKLEALEFDVERAVEMTTGEMSNRSRNLPQFGPIKIVKSYDASSMGLLTEALKGKGQPVEIHVVQAGSTVIIKLKNAILKGHGTSVAAGDSYIEQLSIAFSHIEVKSDTGNKGSTSVSYDLAKGTTY